MLIKLVLVADVVESGITGEFIRTEQSKQSGNGKLLGKSSIESIKNS